MVLDNDEEKINEILPFVTSAQIGDGTKAAVLESLGIDNFDICVVSVGENFQASLEATSLLKEGGAKFVLSRASTEIQAKFLLRNGADEVVFAEKEMAERLAVKYSANNIFDYIPRQIQPQHPGDQAGQQSRTPARARLCFQQCGTAHRDVPPRRCRQTGTLNRAYRNSCCPQDKKRRTSEQGSPPLFVSYLLYKCRTSPAIAAPAYCDAPITPATMPRINPNTNCTMTPTSAPLPQDFARFGS